MAVSLKFETRSDGTVQIELTANAGDCEKPEWKAAINLAVVGLSGPMFRPHDCPRIANARMTIKTSSGEKISRTLGNGAG